MPASVRALFRAAALTPYWLGRPPSAERVRRYQDRRIRDLAALAARENSFYRRIWAEAGVDPDSIRCAEDLARLPVVTKSQMRESDAELPPPDVDRSTLVRIKTSGSSGNPMEIRRTAAEDKLLAAFRTRSLLDYGLGVTGTRVHLHAASSRAPLKRGVKGHPWWVRLGVFHRYAVSFFEDKERLLETVRDLRPTMLGGHAGALWRMSQETPRGRLRSLGLRFVTPSIETVPPMAKQQISEAFGVPAFITYGSTEFNLLAAECPETGLLHLNELCNYVEVIKDGRAARDGESGEVVATNLQAELVPFIRFDLGDWATMGPELCPCGAGVRTLRAVEGRVLELFRLPDGTAVHPFQMSIPLQSFCEWLGEHRIVQVEPGLIRILFTVLRNRQAPDDAPALVAAAAGGCAAGRARVEACRVDELPPFEKGKNRQFQPLTA